ncbi:hypothetical protein BC628DRAFT_811645 [Trametes gibbosa]|nr:hypothetical protein BC628DRAFT_811645 [Trametes gibbosa]
MPDTRSKGTASYEVANEVLRVTPDGYDSRWLTVIVFKSDVPDMPRLSYLQQTSSRRQTAAGHLLSRGTYPYRLSRHYRTLPGKCASNIRPAQVLTLADQGQHHPLLRCGRSRRLYRYMSDKIRSVAYRLLSAVPPLSSKSDLWP